eukprot:TRINITY_DN77022_c0_g1_i1.p1 TRINITY_DN77022_c0_g1~~TRINITY_DN77022_c0_g1_i1.p1  ORF type:complete len:496 (-),score=63.70 TRINITY_DN77022_c0_g1_i1:25-1512(-)
MSPREHNDGDVVATQLCQHTRIIVHSLKSAFEYNGSRGVIVSGPHVGSGRYEVALAGTVGVDVTQPSNSKVLSLKLSNLRVDMDNDAIGSEESDKNVRNVVRESHLHDTAILWTRGRGLSSKALIVQTRSVPELQERQVLLQVDKFSFSHLSLGYLLKGFLRSFAVFHQIHPSSEDKTFRSGCWGIATILETNHSKVTAGTRLFGFFPPCRYAVCSVGAVVAPATPSDTARIVLSSDDVPFNFSRFLECEVLDPGMCADPSWDDWRIAMKEPYTAAFYMDEQLLVETGMIKRVIISCASAKTAIALAYCLRMRGMANVIGVTSESHREFASSTDLYHEVISYDEVQSLPTNQCAVFVDFRCDEGLRQTIAKRLGTQLMCSMLVGPSTFQKKATELRFEQARGREVSFDEAAWRQRRRRVAEVTQTNRDETLRYSFAAFVERMRRHIRLRTVSGSSAFIEMYASVYSNLSPPGEAYICSLSANGDESALDEIWTRG